MKPNGHGNFRLLTLLVLLQCALLLGLSRFRITLVVGNSMRPGLQTGDLLIIDKRAYTRANPDRNDVVLARYGKDLIVKRVVGLPGERVEIRGGHLYVNSFPVAEPHPIQPGNLAILPGTLFSERYALLGDNRSMGNSQNVHAVLPKEAILGKVIRVLNWHGMAERFQARGLSGGLASTCFAQAASSSGNGGCGGVL